MKPETVAIHGGYDVEPTTKAVAVPIYQTVAYSFDSADHGAALFNLEVEGFRYSRISNPTTAVLERRVAELEGGCGALAVSTGQAASTTRSCRWPIAGGTSFPFHNSTAPRTPCSRTSCRSRGSIAGSPQAPSRMPSRA